jgi:hypothetical protein
MVGFFSWLFGAKAKADDASAPKIGPATTDDADPSIISLDDPRYDQWFEKRRAYWRQFGAVDDDVIAYIISPQFTGAPAWPTTRQAFFIIRTPNSVIIASDGLTDLFVDTNMTEAGFKSEVYIETDSLVGADFDMIRGSWAFSLVEQFARNVANWGGIHSNLERLGVISTEMPAPENMPKDWIAAEDRVGMLVNLPVKGRNGRLPLDEFNNIWMVPVTIVTPAELAFLEEGGSDARKELASRITSAGIGAVSSASRKSLV